jgi:hypothetical protein
VFLELYEENRIEVIYDNCMFILFTRDSIIHLHSIPLSPFPHHCLSNICMYTFIVYVTCCHFQIYVYNISVWSGCTHTYKAHTVSKCNIKSTNIKDILRHAEAISSKHNCMFILFVYIRLNVLYYLINVQLDWIFF